MKIIVDAFGGDNAPACALEGAVAAKKEYGVEIALSGNVEKIKAAAKELNISLEGFDFIDAEDEISMHDEPSNIIKSKKNCSMAAGLNALKEGRGNAFVSAGSTGALVVGSTMFVKRIKGVKRAAIASIIPTANGSYMLLDMGANAECRPEMLAQFAIMASAYMKNACGLDNPTVGLLNIGTEDTKGDELRKETYALLKTAPVNFIGNVEARELANGAADIVVTDGFTGNVVLKLTEGVASTLFKLIKRALYKNIINKLCALIIKKDLYALKSMMDSSEVGGALLLGISAPVIKAHGNSDAKAIKHAIRAAARFADSGVISATEEGLAEFQLNGAQSDAE